MMLMIDGDNDALVVLMYQGVIIGSLCGMFVLTWITVGALQADAKHPTLAPTDVRQCSAAAANNSLLWQQSTVVSDWTTSARSTAHLRNETYHAAQVRINAIINTTQVSVSDGSGRLIWVP